MRQRTERALATALAMLMVSLLSVHAQLRVMSLDDLYRLPMRTARARKSIRRHLTAQRRESRLQDTASIINHQLVTMLHLPEETQIQADTTLLMRSELLGNSKDYDGWQQQASTSNLGLKQAQLGAEMAQQQLKATRAASLPHLALVAEEHLGGPYVNDLIPTDVNTNAWFIGLGVQYQLSSLYKNNHNIRKARLDARKALEEVALAEEGVNNGVQTCYVNYQTAFTEVRTQQKNVELATQNYDVVSHRYNNDLALLTDMLDASNVRLAAEMALVNSRINLLYSYYKLKYITHTL